MTFEDFNFAPELMDGLSPMGYDRPTPVQEQAIPLILKNKDIVACAQTGTGKTAAYLLPIMDKIIKGPKKHVNTLVIAPTRELAMQIDQQVEGMAYFSGITSLAMYGGGDGVDWEQQKRALSGGVDILIATPGRLIAHLSSHPDKLRDVEHLVLDEADRMLDMGFHDDIMKIVEHLPQKNRQTLLFSATMPPKIRKLANNLLHEPEEVSIAISAPAEGILQQAYLTHDSQKLPLLKEILLSGDYKSVLIFASRITEVKQLHNELRKLKFQTAAFHSGLEQDEREELMRKFKSGRIPVLVGTDILSRGIDVEGIELVVNYSVPRDPEDYVHRIGRTARAERKGTAITFVNIPEQTTFQRIEGMIKKEIPKLSLPEKLGKGPFWNPKAGGGKGRGKKPFRKKGFRKKN